MLFIRFYFPYGKHKNCEKRQDFEGEWGIITLSRFYFKEKSIFFFIRFLLTKIVLEHLDP